MTTDGLTRQEQLFGARRADQGTLRAENARLYPFVRAIRAIVTEAKIDPTDDGLRVTALNGENVAMVDATVAIDGTVPEATIGADIQQLAGKLQNKPRDATVTLDCAIPSGVLRLDEEFANGRVWDVRERIRFLDPNSVRERPDIPDLEFSTTVELDLSELSTLLNRLPDQRPVEIRAEDGELSIGSISKGSDPEDGHYSMLASVEYASAEDASALYGVSYFRDILDGIAATDASTVRLSWSEEYPMRIEADGKHVSTAWILAPRVTGDD